MSEAMNIIIAGSRNFDDYRLLNDDSRSGWFDKKDLKNTTELIINREELPISGTMLRALMIQDKRREWMTFVNPKLHKMYDEIRSELMESIKEN